MTAKKKAQTRTGGKARALKKTTRKRDGFGRVRLSDNSMKAAGVRKGDIAVLRLLSMPADGDLCAALTAWGELVVRRFQRKANGDVTLTTGAKREVPQVFAPGGLFIFGRVERVEKGGA